MNKIKRYALYISLPLMAIFIFLAIDSFLFRKKIHTVSNEYDQMISDHQQRIAEYQEEIKKNSHLWTLCSDSDTGTVDATVDGISTTLPCSPLQEHWNQTNNKNREIITELSNNMCRIFYQRNRAINQAISSSSRTYNEPMRTLDTSCYDPSYLNIGDMRWKRSINSITIHHTATDLLPAQQVADAATRHHGAVPAHMFIDHLGDVVYTADIKTIVGSTRDPYANRSSVHIELVWTFLDGGQPTEAQMQSLAREMQKIQASVEKDLVVTGHRRWNSPTTCPWDFPFDNLMERLDEHFTLYEWITNETTDSNPIRTTLYNHNQRYLNETLDWSISYTDDMSEQSALPTTDIHSSEGLDRQPQVGDVIFMDNVTAYYWPEPDQDYYFKGSYEADLQMNCWGEHECVNADGRAYLHEHQYTHGACWPRFPKGTVLDLEGRGEIVCVDRGSAIDNTDIDIRYGRGQEAVDLIRWGMPHPKQWNATVISLP